MIFSTILAKQKSKIISLWKKVSYMVGNKTQKKLGIPKKNLLIVMDNNVIITTYYIDNLADFLFGKKYSKGLQSISII